jgi:hypothetical protein
MVLDREHYDMDEVGVIGEKRYEHLASLVVERKSWRCVCVCL